MGKLGELGFGSDMNYQRVIRGSPLRLKNATARLGVPGVRAEAVDGLRGKHNEPAFLQKTGSVLDLPQLFFQERSVSIH